MKKIIQAALGIALALGLCSVAARAGLSYTVSGNDGYSLNYANISIPSTCSISTTITLDRNGSFPYGSGVSYVYRGSTLVLYGLLELENNTHVSQTWSTSGQAAGTYEFRGVCALGAPKLAVITASFNW